MVSSQHFDPKSGYWLVMALKTELVDEFLATLTSSVGAVETVRVGDSSDVVRARWGAPSRERQQRRYLDFARARWVQTVELRDGTVVEITVMLKHDP